MLSRIAADFNNKTIEFKEGHRKFYENLKTELNNLNTDVSNLKSQFQIEIQIIANLKLDSWTIDGFLGIYGNPGAHDRFLESVEKLSADCNRYCKRLE